MRSSREGLMFKRRHNRCTSSKSNRWSCSSSAPLQNCRSHTASATAAPPAPLMSCWRSAQRRRSVASHMRKISRVAAMRWSALYPPSSTYTTLTAAIKAFADGFVAVNAKYTPANGGLSEQYDKSSGAPTSAVDLTWSYASALTAFAARGGFASPGWGAQGLTVPSTCSGSSGATVAVTFNVQATTVFGGKLQTELSR